MIRPSALFAALTIVGAAGAIFGSTAGMVIFAVSLTAYVIAQMME